MWSKAAVRTKKPTLDVLFLETMQKSVATIAASGRRSPIKAGPGFIGIMQRQSRRNSPRIKAITLTAVLDS